MPTTDYDVIIIGSGISGALIANQLAGNGAKVLILEAGETTPDHQENINNFYAASIKTPGAPYPPTADAPRPDVPLGPDIWKNPDAFKSDPRYYYVQTGPDAFGSTYERLTGGTTQHWLGTSMRLLPEDFETQSRFGFADDWPLTYGELEPWYTLAEYEIGVAGDAAVDDALGATHSKPYPMPEVPISYSDQVLKKKLDGKVIDGQTISVAPTPQARNTVFYDKRPICMGNTSCVPVCPIKAKYDASVHLNKALNQSTPATLQTRSVVHRINIDNTTGDVSSISYKTWDGTEHTVSGRYYVLAAHAIETAKILLMSPWKTDSKGNDVSAANTSGLVGKRLMDHICLVAWGLSDEPLHPYRGPLSTSGIGNFRHGTFRSDSAAFRIEIGNEGWNWPTGAPDTLVQDYVNTQELFGHSLRSTMKDNSINQIRIALELEATPLESSYVKPSSYTDHLGIPRPELHYCISDSTVPGGDYTLKGYQRATDLYPQLFQEAGIQDFTDIDTTPGTPGLFTYNKTAFQFRGAGHVIGTYTMGTSPDNSVVDKYQRSWDHKNLFLVGSGVFPTTGTANPTLTIAALALWAAQTITADLKSA